MNKAKILCISVYCFVVSSFFCIQLYAADIEPYYVYASSEYTEGSKSKLTDGNVDAGNYWSSNLYTSPNNTEYIKFWFTAQNVNYVKIHPRTKDGVSLSFPEDFDIYYDDGTHWNFAERYTDYPAIQQDGWIILPLKATYHCIGIRIRAHKLRTDGSPGVSNYYFQLSEVTAGYDPDLNRMQYVAHNPTLTQVEIRNVGSDSFNPDKVSNWHPDIRYPLIRAHNIYAPNIVRNGSTWNIYFGGWWDEEQRQDEIYIKTTTDFFSFSQPYSQIVNSGETEHVNNPSVIKVDSNTWNMAYTILPDKYQHHNITGYATSSDGVNWTPSMTGAGALISIEGYDQDEANINGGNVLLYDENDEDPYNLYFTDVLDPIVRRAIGTDGKNFGPPEEVPNKWEDTNWVENGWTANDWIANDVKQFQYNGTNHYFMLLHRNRGMLLHSISTDKTSFPQPEVLFTSVDGNIKFSEDVDEVDGEGRLVSSEIVGFVSGDGCDRYMATAGLITTGNRLYGVLYGGSCVAAKNENDIYASWLQKQVYFYINSDEVYGHNELAFGPDRIRLEMAKKDGSSSEVATGSMHVYDSDGTTRLFTSPSITVREGDIFNYNP